MAQIIADHTVVAQYADIPAAYIAAVKCMLFSIPGESHSAGYTNGATLLQTQDPTYACTCTGMTTAPAVYQTTGLRVARAHRTATGWENCGEEEWFTNAAGITEMKNHITYCENNNRHIAAMGFGWCWDMTQSNLPGGTIDDVYTCHWAGASSGGPEGNVRWGLDAADTALTGNSVCLDTYLAATEQYIAYCTAQGYTTKVIFTTGPVDSYSGENAYQRHLKQERIRDYVLADSTRILFDYADILAWNNAGEENVQDWYSGGIHHYYQTIAADNLLDLDGDPGNGDADHIGERGALRIAKAVWWMMAKIAGWSDRDNRIAIGVRNT